MRPLLSEIARHAKRHGFFSGLPLDTRILEMGCGRGRVRDWAKARGWRDYAGLDLASPADVVGDVRNWRRLGLAEGSFGLVVAFEVVAHVRGYREVYDLLESGGLFFLTTPVPCADGVLSLLERLGLNQRRTSPHDFLVDVRDVPLFEPVAIRRVLGLSQWAKLRKPARETLH